MQYYVGKLWRQVYIYQSYYSLIVYQWIFFLNSHACIRIFIAWISFTGFKFVLCQGRKLHEYFQNEFVL